MFGTITVTNSTATYAWNTGKTTASINVTPTTNTTYTVTATDNNCTATDDVDVNVTPNPTVDLGIDVAICQGDSTLLDAGSGHTNYLWNTERNHPNHLCRYSRTIMIVQRVMERQFQIVIV